MTDAATIFHIESPHAVLNIRKRLDAELSKLGGDLTLSADWADYSKRLGRIDGIKTALAICEEAEKNER